ncbi:MAG TPA: KGK domain-containing protein [Leptolyngbyaceae cyanobacterium]
MEFNSYLQKCGNDDVIQFKNNIYKLGQVKTSIEYSFINKDVIPSVFSSYLSQNKVFMEIPDVKLMFEQGLDAEILRIGAKGWEKGKLKIKVTLEFEPDETEIKQPESPLDDLRQILNQNNQ